MCLNLDLLQSSTNNPTIKGKEYMIDLSDTFHLSLSDDPIIHCGREVVLLTNLFPYLVYRKLQQTDVYKHSSTHWH